MIPALDTADPQRSPHAIAAFRVIAAIRDRAASKVSRWMLPIVVAGIVSGAAAAGGATGSRSAIDSNDSVGGSTGLYLVNADGSGLRRFAHQVAAAHGSPDGNSVAGQAHDAGADKPLRHHAKFAVARQEEVPCWSRDGWIAYSSNRKNRKNRADLWVARASTQGAERRLT